MSQDKVMSLVAGRYSDISKNNKVFNKSALEYHLWIYMDPEDVREAYFYEAKEIGPNPDNSKIFPDTFIRESQCWLRVNMLYLNLTPGMHTYKLSLVNRFTDDDFSLYFSYTIQDDCPKRPYVYMHQEENDGSMPVDSGMLPPFIPHRD